MSRSGFRLGFRLGHLLNRTDGRLKVLGGIGVEVLSPTDPCDKHLGKLLTRGSINIETNRVHPHLYARLHQRLGGPTGIALTGFNPVGNQHDIVILFCHACKGACTFLQ